MKTENLIVLNKGKGVSKPSTACQYNMLSDKLTYMLQRIVSNLLSVQNKYKKPKLQIITSVPLNSPIPDDKLTFDVKETRSTKAPPSSPESPESENVVYTQNELAEKRWMNLKNLQIVLQDFSWFQTYIKQNPLAGILLIFQEVEACMFLAHKSFQQEYFYNMKYKRDSKLHMEQPMPFLIQNLRRIFNAKVSENGHIYMPRLFLIMETIYDNYDPFYLKKYEQLESTQILIDFLSVSREKIIVEDYSHPLIALHIIITTFPLMLVILFEYIITSCKTRNYMDYLSYQAIEMFEFAKTRIDQKRNNMQS